MGPDSAPHDHQYDAAPQPQYGPGGQPFAPLPPSRRQRDTNAQWIVVVLVAVGSLVAVALILGIRPSKSVTPAPRAPSTHSQQDCTYQYLSCPTTTGWPR